MHDLSEIESASPVGVWDKNVVVTTAVDRNGRCYPDIVSEAAKRRTFLHDAAAHMLDEAYIACVCACSTMLASTAARCRSESVARWSTLQQALSAMLLVGDAGPSAGCQQLGSVISPGVGVVVCTGTSSVTSGRQPCNPACPPTMSVSHLGGGLGT